MKETKFHKPSHCPAVENNVFPLTGHKTLRSCSNLKKQSVAHGLNQHGFWTQLDLKINSISSSQVIELFQDSYAMNLFTNTTSDTPKRASHLNLIQWFTDS